MTEAESPEKKAEKKAGKKESIGGHKDRFWIPRFWNGMQFGPWWRLLRRNRFDLSARRVGMAVINAGLGPINWAFATSQNWRHGRRIEETEITEPPIFILGHWRSGTTLLHELLILDERHSYPDTYVCFSPSHFISSGPMIRPVVRHLLPNRRPIDNMAAGWERPQEDEFALCNLGLPSPYLTIAFPNRPPQCQEYLDFRGVPEEAKERWKETFLWFLKAVSYHTGNKRIVLKSPTHTARIRVLLEMFPDARFVHIVRDPFVIFPSTMNLWKRLYRDQGVQVPKYEGLEKHVFTTLKRMYDAFEADKGLIPEGRLAEVRYEEIVADPVGNMQSIYETLELGGFDRVRPQFEQYAEKHKDYKTNRYALAPELREQIADRWSRYIETYGYEGRRG